MTIVRGKTFNVTYAGHLTNDQLDDAHADLARREDQLSFDLGKWVKERQEASDRAGLREQLKYYGPGKVWRSAPTPAPSEEVDRAEEDDA